MRDEFSLRSFSLFIFIIFFLLCSTFYSCNAVRSKHLRQMRILSAHLSKKKGMNNNSNYSDDSNPNSLVTLPRPMKDDGGGPSTIFNVLDFGAIGDGTTDDTKAFQNTWTAACKVKASTVLVPSDSTFIVGPIAFLGRHCQPNIVFQLDGTIIAPKGARVWGSGMLQWIQFKKLSGITIQGRGVIDGYGHVWWAHSELDNLALRFYGTYNVTVTGITIQNSPKCHLKFDNCAGVKVFNMTVSSPGNSPNTDGIHLQNSQDVSIHNTNLACGDDCVSIQTGCTNVNIHNVHCGPGHGISIGGLGKDDTKACVSNITVRDIIMQNTMNGVRIKTWQGGSGSVQGVLFSNIQVFEVKHPIVIDQFYCDREKCKNHTTAVALSNINFEKINGTYTSKPVHLACSDAFPCTDVTLTGIELHPFQKGHGMSNPFCWQAYGELLTPSIPPIECLRPGKPSGSRGLSYGHLC